MDVRAPDVRASLPSFLLIGLLASVSPLSAHVPAVPLPVAPAARIIAASRSVPAVDAPAVPRPLARAAEPAAPSARPRPWWGWMLLGRLHPVVVHFPIALLTIAAVIEGLHLWRRRPVPSEAGTYCLAFGVAGAVAAVCLGTLNAGHQSVTGDAALAVERHQLMGWISMIAAAAALGAGRIARRAAQVRHVAVYMALVVATGAVVGATGHMGGGLVYGEDYLTGVLPWNQDAEPARAASGASPEGVTPEGVTPAPGGAAAMLPVTVRAAAASPVARASAPAAEPALSQAADAPDFTRDVMPIFDRTCVECHGPDKVKARLRMDSVEALQKGGKSGALLKPGDPENSLLLRRVLGLDGEDQMPLDKDPLSEKQIDTLRRWIAAGAVYPGGGSQ